MQYSVQLRDFYGFLFFAKSMGKNVGKNISTNLSGKFKQNLLDHAKLSATDAFKTAPKRAIQKITKGTGDLIGDKIADKITSTSKTFPKNNLETNEEEIFREKHISPELRQKVIDNLRLKKEN